MMKTCNVLRGDEYLQVMALELELPEVTFESDCKVLINCLYDARGSMPGAGLFCSGRHQVLGFFP